MKAKNAIILSGNILIKKNNMTFEEITDTNSDYEFYKSVDGTPDSLYLERIIQFHHPLNVLVPPVFFYAVIEHENQRILMPFSANIHIYLDKISKFDLYKHVDVEILEYVVNLNGSRLIQIKQLYDQNFITAPKDQIKELDRIKHDNREKNKFISSLQNEIQKLKSEQANAIQNKSEIIEEKREKIKELEKENKVLNILLKHDKDGLHFYNLFNNLRVELADANNQINQLQKKIDKISVFYTDPIFKKFSYHKKGKYIEEIIESLTKEK